MNVLQPVIGGGSGGGGIVGTFTRAIMGNSATGQNPAISRSTPAGVSEMLVGAFFNFVSDAGYGNRQIAIELFAPDTFHVAIITPRDPQPASANIIYTALQYTDSFQGMGWSAGSVGLIVLPAVWLPPGSSITVGSTGPAGAAADQITNLGLTFMQAAG